MMQWKEGTQR